MMYSVTRRRYGERRASEMTETSRFYRQATRGVGAWGHAELCIGTREVHLDGVHGEAQPLGDLLVGEPLGGQLDDVALGRRELAVGPALAAADPRQVRPREVGPAAGAELV